ncbi:RlmF-related methyltransferase, partial [Neptuniibacter sp.]|uniref:RlmF-related methyltransferase n=1 Tax=Neptuniibacter sp. TaxID=1962643 RepID=UPI002629384A
SKFNPVLKKKICCRLQKSQENIFKGVIQQDERFDFTLCNPPFHASLSEATAGSKRKVRNLSKASGKEAPEKLELNFAGQGAELWCKGGEIAFVRKMIKESAEFAENCLWFTCLISKKDNLPAVYQALKGVKAKTVKTIDMAQGQKISRFVAWSFYNAEQRQQWADEFWK